MKLFLNKIFIFTIAILAISNANAQTINFDKNKINISSTELNCGLTGMGYDRWLVVNDTTAPSGSNVLHQSGIGSYPWCMVPNISIQDGFVQTKFKPISGHIDRAGGVIWRFTSKDSYYVARANALEDNVSLYYVKNGRRITIEYVKAPVKNDNWNTLRVEFKDKRIQVFLNGVKYIDLEDTQITNAGSVGVWTKADSNTKFDDLTFTNI